MSPLLGVLRERLLPAVDGSLPGRTLLVAQPTRKEFLQRNEPLPQGVSIARRKPPGQRVAVRGAHPYRETARPTARWPRENLIEAVVPMLICPVEGQVDFRFSDYSAHLPAGQFCLIPPEVPRTDGSQSHIEDRDESATCDLFWLRPRDGALECWVCHSHGAHHIGGETGRRVYIAYQDAIPHFDRLLREAHERADGWEQVCKSLLIIMLTVVQRRLIEGEFYGPASRPLPDAPAENDVVSFARCYMQDHLQEHLTIENVARACYISRTQLTTQFREKTDQTFAQYLTQIRLERARALLCDTDWSIRGIAVMIGVTPCHLRDLFVQYHGVSPRVFRRQARVHKP
jgi:AraC-like DNA-binding protein